MRVKNTKERPHMLTLEGLIAVISLSATMFALGFSLGYAIGHEDK